MSLQTIRTVNEHLALEKVLNHSTVLLVEDNESLRMATINQLRHLGAGRVLAAENGLAALKILAKHPVSLIVSDWNMPEMNGLDLLLSVRSSIELYAVPFLLVTAHAERERIAHAAHVGVSGFLVRPYTSQKLGERIAKALQWQAKDSGPIDPVAKMAELGVYVEVNGKQVRSHLTQAPARLPELDQASAKGVDKPLEKSVEKQTLLVVDDTPENLMLVAQIFKEQYRVKIAHNGTKALSICQSDSPPDLVLLDVMMPDMDGFQVAAAMREHPTSSEIPVIFVTALTDQSSRDKAAALGAIDFVTKPVNPDMLFFRVQNFMRQVALEKAVQDDYDEILKTQALRRSVAAPMEDALGLLSSLTGGVNLTEAQRKILAQIEAATRQALAAVR